MTTDETEMVQINVNDFKCWNEIKKKKNDVKKGGKCKIEEKSTTMLSKQKRIVSNISMNNCLMCVLQLKQRKNAIVRNVTSDEYSLVQVPFNVRSLHCTRNSSNDKLKLNFSTKSIAFQYLIIYFNVFCTGKKWHDPNIQEIDWNQTMYYRI